MANVNIELGYKTLIWFNANPTLVLLAGQIIYLGQTGTYKIGDGVSTLSALSFLGISSETQTLQNVTDLGNTTTNSITANSFIKSGGLVTEFLKADGSIDSNTYLTSSDLTNLVPYTGATNDVDLGEKELTTGKLWLYDAVGGATEKGSLHYADEALHFENSDGETLLYIEPGFMQIHKDGTTQSNFFVTNLTANRDHYLPDASGTIALTSNIGSWGGLNYPTWTSGTPFVKMTAAGTFALDTNTYLTSITSGMVTTALGFTPYNATNPSGYITGITSGMVTTALGFTPYNATNPSGYITSSALSPYALIANPTFTTAITTPIINGVSGVLAFNNVAQTSGATVPFTFTKPNSTNQTASTPISGFVMNGGTRQWATGAITTQNENVWGATTYSFVGASTITNAYGNVFNAPIAGTNCTITNNFAAQFNGKVYVNGNVGVGTTTPYDFGLGGQLKVLNVDGSNYGCVIASSNNGNVKAMMIADNTGLLAKFGTLTNHQFQIITNNATQGTIQSNGNWGIGTTTDAGFRLDVNGTGRFQNDLTIGSTNQLIEIKQTATAPTITQTGSVSSTIYTVSSGLQVKMQSVAGGQNWLFATGGRFLFGTSDSQPLEFYTATTKRMEISAAGILNFYGATNYDNAVNITFGTTTGTKIGTLTTQKLSFWNATPIVQPATGGGASTFVSNTSLLANDTATFDGYTIGQVVKALRNMGLLA